MKRRFVYFTYFILLSFFINCSQTSKESSVDTLAKSEIKDNKQEQSKVDTVKQASSKLLIIGKNIWIRSEPTTGQVVMKLNNGDACEILEKGKKENIKGIEDYWYKIKSGDKTGWVFGSQTSVRQLSNGIFIGNTFISPTLSENELFNKIKSAFEQFLKDEIAKMEGPALTKYNCTKDFTDDHIFIASISTEICDASCYCKNYSFPLKEVDGKWHEYTFYLNSGQIDMNKLIQGNVKKLIKKLSETEYLFLMNDNSNARTSFANTTKVYALIFNSTDGSFTKLSPSAISETPTTINYFKSNDPDKKFDQQELQYTEKENKIYAQLLSFEETFDVNTEKETIKSASKTLKSKKMFEFNTTTKQFVEM